ncbi:MAG: AAA family ATPase [Halobacteriovoraceae bacterium]|jgi:chromosome partitioning protein|nr:AAA family ATPase [Halobacteriovoraceae bacterium]MBT5092706.1 AAA family ATPase [Halobacteriovoraceae bacterium]
MGLFNKPFLNNSKNQNNSKPKGKVIAFINQKGGVGKTTMAFNTAYALSEKGHKVLCLDLDPQANLSLLFGVDTAESGDYSIHHLLINSVRELRALHVPLLCGELIVKDQKVHLLPAGQELSGFELSVAGINSPRQLVLKKFLEKNALLEQYDYIVVDCPPTLGLLVVNILCASDGVMVPFRPDEFSRKGLGHFYEALEDIGEMGVSDPPVVLAHIPNLVDARRKQEADDLAKITGELKEAFGNEKMVPPFFNRAQLVKGQAKKKSVFAFSGKDYKGLQEQFSQMATIVEEEWSHEH